MNCWDRRVGIELEYLIPPSKKFNSLLRRAAKTTGHPFKTFWYKQGKSWRCSNWRGNHSSYWVLKDDGSTVTEINTPATSNLTKLHKALKGLETGLPGLWPAGIHEGCGLHVHVDMSDLEDDLRIEVVSTYSKVEDYFFQLQPGYRTGEDDWCNPASDYIEEALSEQYESVPERPWKDDGCELGEIFSGLFDHDQAICFRGLEKYGTIEFRHGASTFSADNIINWATLCRNLVDRVADGFFLTRKPSWETFVKEFLPKQKKWANQQRALFEIDYSHGY